METFLRGAVSASIAAVLLQPFDVVRSMQQAAIAGSGLGSSVGGRNPGALALAIRLVAAEGPSALWKGLAPTLLRVAGGAGLYFSGLDALRRALSGSGRSGSGVVGGESNAAQAARDFFAGAAARAVAALALLPVSVVKTRAELAPSGGAGAPPRSPLAAMLALARTEGAGVLLRGAAPVVLRDAPFSGLYLAAYSRLRTDFANSPTQLSSLPPAARDFAAALTAGALASVLTQPADVLKTRQQMAHAPGIPPAALTLRAIVASQGMRALFTGGTLRMGKRALSTALTWTLFEESARRGSGAA